jgi:ATP-binding cassette subfamily F protein 3
LQEVLAAYTGTILLVSHDRYLIDALATQVWSIQPGQMAVFEGNYQEYVTARDAAKAAERDAKAVPKSQLRQAGTARPTRSGDPGAQKVSAMRVGLSAREREKRTIALEEQIHQLELQLVQLSGDLGAASQAGQVDRVRELGEAYTAAQAELDAKMLEWEALLAY